MTDIWEEDDDLAVQDELGWIPKDDTAAEWCLRKIREADELYATMEEHFKRQKDAAKAHHDKEVARFQWQLQQYLSKVEAAGVAHKTKTATSYKLPTGELIRKTGGVDYKRDDDKLIEWLKASKLSEYVKVKVESSPDWAELKKGTTTRPDGSVVYKETGEVIKGVEAVPKPDKFEVKLM